MLSTTPVESPTATHHSRALRRVPVNGYEPVRSEADGGRAPEHGAPDTGPIAAGSRVLNRVLGAAADPVEAGLRMLAAAGRALGSVQTGTSG